MSRPSGPSSKLTRVQATAPGRKRVSRAEREVGRVSKTAERIAIGVASLVIAIGAIVLLSGYFTSHDQGNVRGTLAGPGLVYPDLGAAQLRPGMPRPKYNSNPPTSGPYLPTPVRSDEAVLTDNQILTALAAGDVVIIYGGATPPPGLAQLARSTAGPFTPAKAALGQSVVLARLPGLNGIIALAWTRMLPITGMTQATPGNDGVLKQFIDAWLGRGAAGSGNS